MTSRGDGMGFLARLFRYYGENRDRNWEYEYLKTAPVLHSSQYLSELYENAENKYQQECILEHMNRYAAWEVDSYKEIEQKYIRKVW